MRVFLAVIACGIIGVEVFDSFFLGGLLAAVVLFFMLANM